MNLVRLYESGKKRTNDRLREKKRQLSKLRYLLENDENLNRIVNMLQRCGIDSIDFVNTDHSEENEVVTFSWKKP